MSKHIIIALDGMGGDHAPDVVIDGADIARKRLKDVSFIAFGDQRKINPILTRYPKLSKLLEVVHTDQHIEASTKPAIAVRNMPRSSMRLAIRAVKENRAHAIVSAGNTGALMAVAKMTLRTLVGVDRPAIAAFLPTENDPCLVLDLGANTQCDSDNLVQFSLMGEVFVRKVLGKNQPSIGLVNIGTEDMKGRESVRNAATVLRQSDLDIDFVGFIEGNDIPAGRVDVAVIDGFSGNIMLKSIEGYSRLYTGFLRKILRRSIPATLAVPLIYPALRRLRRHFDPRLHNGACLLGLNGIVVKSHGSTDALGFSYAIRAAYRTILGDFNHHLKTEFEHLHSACAQTVASQKAS